MAYFKVMPWHILQLGYSTFRPRFRPATHRGQITKVAAWDNLSGRSYLHGM